MYIFESVSGATKGEQELQSGSGYCHLTRVSRLQGHFCGRCQSAVYGCGESSVWPGRGNKVVKAHTLIIAYTGESALLGFLMKASSLLLLEVVEVENELQQSAKG